ncbi:MAG: hypothetical protein RL076_2786 [Chloroflexota bacterium]|jgi:hypothetical protein
MPDHNEMKNKAVDAATDARYLYALISALQSIYDVASIAAMRAYSDTHVTKEDADADFEYYRYESSIKESSWHALHSAIRRALAEINDSL